MTYLGEYSLAASSLLVAAWSNAAYPIVSVLAAGEYTQIYYAVISYEY